MKTSNRLIIGFVIVSFALFVGVHWVLLGKYRKGEFISSEKVRNEEYIRYPIGKPRVISFDGTVWVNLIPADSFALELPRNNEDPDKGMFDYGPQVNLKGTKFEGKALGYQIKGDSLLVKGNTTIAIHRAFSPWFYRTRTPQVNLYAPSFADIILINGQLCLRGASSGTGRSAHLTVVNSTLWLGMQYETWRHDYPENFDSIDITSKNSFIVLNSPANIRMLRATITDSSLISDEYSGLQQAIIGTSTHSRVQLTGEHTAKSKITVQ
jgi:hypothetical protein